MGSISEQLRKAIRSEVATKVDVPAYVVTAVEQEGAPDVRVFDAAAVNEAISRQVSALADDEHVAAIGYLDTKGAHVAIVGRIRNIPFTDRPIPGDFRWTVYHVEEWKGGRETAAGFRWAVKG